MLNSELVRNGYAWWDSRSPGGDPALQENARTQKIGLWVDPSPVAPWDFAAGATASESSSGSSRTHALVACIVILAVLLLITLFLLVFNIGRKRPEIERPRVPASGAKQVPPQEEGSTGMPLAGGEAEALESSKKVVQLLLKSLAEAINDLVERNASHTNRLEDHKASIQKAMTKAGLEEIERLLIQELESMQSANEKYRVQLAQADLKLQEQREIMKKIQVDAKLDFLTKVANRRAFEARLSEELARTQRHGNRFSLIMFDLDHFKQVNDRHGHVVGDKMLQVVAHLMEEQIRVTDCVGRFGGEEFVVLLPETSARQGWVVADKIRRAIENSGLKHERSIIKITVSAGVGEVAAAGDTIETLIARVDAALYRAKQAGRNRVELAEGNVEA